MATFASVSPAQQTAGRHEPVERELGADRFIAGGVIAVTHPVTGDLIAAGGTVDVSAEVSGDAVVVGGQIGMGAPIRQGLYAAGGRVSVNAPVQRNVRMAGGMVEIGPQAKIAGNVTVGGGEVRILGAIGGYLQVGGGHVFIDGPVAGDVEAGSSELELGPNARIAGRLRYASREELRRDPSAQVQGGVERFTPSPAWHRPSGARAYAGHGVGWVWSFGLMLLAAILTAAFPDLCAGVVTTVRMHWAASLLVGFIALVCIPVAAIIVMLTVIGAPLALLTIALYLALLLVGYVCAGVAAGQLALRRFQAARAAQTGWRLAAAVLGMLAISLLGRLPFVGGLIVFAAMLLGVGALLMQMRPRAKSA